MGKNIVIEGINPLEQLSVSESFIQANIAIDKSWGETGPGYLNVHTGCYVVAIVESPSLLSKKKHFTGEIVAIWNNSQSGMHGFKLPIEDASEFVNKVTKFRN